MQRILEPEVMDTVAEAVEYDAMDFTSVNTDFAQLAISLCPENGTILDLGTGTARIPILIAQQRQRLNIIGIDLSENMLKIGSENVSRAGLNAKIKLEKVDAKNLDYSDRQFDGIISNSIIHHLPDPLPCLKEIKRVLKPNSSILLRDLLRPENTETRDNLVEEYAADCNPHQRQLFRDSLQAAFTLKEVEQMIQTAGLEGVKVYQSSDRHWTAERASH
ncbi:MAG: class I SAM-dependent methyltransferase [Microcoleaceae cyanobacterium]